jgi:hypothetical protein
MTRHLGTEKAEPGLYVSFRQLAFTPLSEAGPLPGSTEDVYYRVPLIVMFLTAPVLGLAFVMFLPLIGFGMMAYLLGHKTAELASSAARDAAHVLRPGWEPSLAFLSRSRRTKSEAAETTADDWSRSVEKQIEEADRHE